MTSGAGTRLAPGEGSASQGAGERGPITPSPAPAQGPEEAGTFTENQCKHHPGRHNDTCDRCFAEMMHEVLKLRMLVKVAKDLVEVEDDGHRCPRAPEACGFCAVRYELEALG